MILDLSCKKPVTSVHSLWFSNEKERYLAMQGGVRKEVANMVYYSRPLEKLTAKERKKKEKGIEGTKKELTRAVLTAAKNEYNTCRDSYLQFLQK